MRELRLLGSYQGNLTKNYVSDFGSSIAKQIKKKLAKIHTKYFEHA